MPWFATFCGPTKDYNRKETAWKEALRSPFLERIRHTPSLFKKGRLACSLVENIDQLRTIADQSGATCTDQ